MQTATATVAGRRRVSFTLPEPAATTFIPMCGRPGDGSGQGSECSRRWPRFIDLVEVVESLALRRGVS